jgi:uncharacterized protein YqeY
MQVVLPRQCAIWSGSCEMEGSAMREAINDSYKAAMKAGDKRRTGTFRAIVAAIKDKDIDARGQGKGPISDADLLVMLQKMVKQREESLGIFEKAGREDLAVVEREEIAIISELLPQMMGDAEVDAAIAAAIAKTGAAGGKDMGKVIAALKAEYPGRIDFGKASPRVKAALG